MFKRLPCWLMVALAVLAAGPAAAHEWVDYFDTGEARLSPRGYRTALEVAAYFADAPAGSEVIILAHMDTDEATRFDEALTRRRAWAMMFELLILGVPPEAFRIELRGATQLARPSDGPERLNRRVVVDVKHPPPLPPGVPRPPGPLTHYDQPRLYFDSGSAVVSEFGELALRQAMHAYRSGRTRVVVTGYADTLGPAAANQRLSERRAESVARALVRLGVRWSDIEMVGRGELELARPTPDGQSEPLNRHATVYFWTRLGER